MCDSILGSSLAKIVEQRVIKNRVQYTLSLSLSLHMFHLLQIPTPSLLESHMDLSQPPTIA